MNGGEDDDTLQSLIFETGNIDVIPIHVDTDSISTGQRNGNGNYLMPRMMSRWPKHKSYQRSFQLSTSFRTISRISASP